MSDKKRTRAKLTREGITQAGFIEISPGVYEKAPSGRALSDTRPPPTRVERCSKKKSPRKNGAKVSGKESNSTGVRYQLVIISYRARAIDPSNCCIKWIEDHLVNEGLIPDDSVWFCNPPIVHQVIVPTKEQKTEVFLFEIDP